MSPPDTFFIFKYSPLKCVWPQTTNAYESDPTYACKVQQRLKAKYYQRHICTQKNHPLS